MQAIQASRRQLSTCRDSIRLTLHELRENMTEGRDALENLRKQRQNRDGTNPLQNPGASAPERITPAAMHATDGADEVEAGGMEMLSDLTDFDIDSPITAAQAAAYAQCGRRRVEYAMNNGELEYMGAKGMRRTTRRWVTEWLIRLRDKDDQ